MASTYPTSLDNFTNPTVSDYLNSTTVPHATQHSDLNDAVENLQAKVGIDGSADTDSIDYKVTDAASRITTLEAGATANAIVAYADLSARTAANPSPSEGDVSWQEDTNRFDIYDGSSWTQVNGGIVAYARSIAASATVTAGVTTAFLSSSAFTPVAGRKYRVTYNVGYAYKTTGAGNLDILLRLGVGTGGTILDGILHSTSTLNQYFNFEKTTILTSAELGTSSTVLTITVSSNTNSGQFTSDSIRTSNIIVEDIGA